MAAVARSRGVSLHDFVDSDEPAYNLVRFTGGLWIWSYIRRARDHTSTASSRISGKDGRLY
jgi:hypothetical protein